MGMPYPTFESVTAARTRWAKTRQRLLEPVLEPAVEPTSSDLRDDEQKCVPKTHYVTYASEMKDGLRDLIDSAKFSGVSILVSQRY